MLKKKSTVGSEEKGSKEKEEWSTFWKIVPKHVNSGGNWKPMFINI